ncbi:hypothetical protein [Ereboglobus luteus]|uniref:hypothetical protein n=1 Tax=Ereboglobus luteus TaxID=1796921 RepID=UPI001375392B|nr:hypothetical protein [Ereboglobus luteus]
MISKNAFDQKGRRIRIDTSMGLNTAALDWDPVPPATVPPPVLGRRAPTYIIPRPS